MRVLLIKRTAPYMYIFDPDKRKYHYLARTCTVKGKPYEQLLIQLKDADLSKWSDEIQKVLFLVMQLVNGF